MPVFWDMEKCGSSKKRSFGDTCRLHHLLPNCLTLFHSSSYLFYPEDEGNIPPKRRFIINPGGTTSQKMSFFIVTVVKTSNPTFTNQFLKLKKYIWRSKTQTVQTYQKKRAINLDNPPPPSKEHFTQDCFQILWQSGLLCCQKSNACSLRKVAYTCLHKFSWS
jgi:hypothetical protein